MSIELTNEQLRAAPVRIIDPETNEEYVIVRAAVYDRLRGVLDEDDVRRFEPLLAELSPEDWEDPSTWRLGGGAGVRGCGAFPTRR